MTFLPRTPAGATTPSVPPSAADLLPPPQTFDFLPPLHALLCRLLPSSPSLTNPQAQSNPYKSSPSDAGPTEDAALAGDPSLEIQHLAAEAAAIKIRIQKARAAVAALPDVERSVEEQEEEIGALERRIGEQKKVLRTLRGMGLASLG